jgi:hypothetical protein
MHKKPQPFCQLHLAPGIEQMRKQIICCELLAPAQTQRVVNHPFDSRAGDTPSQMRLDENGEVWLEVLPAAQGIVIVNG